MDVVIIRKLGIERVRILLHSVEGLIVKEIQPTHTMVVVMRIVQEEETVVLMGVVEFVEHVLRIILVRVENVLVHQIGPVVIGPFVRVVFKLVHVMIQNVLKEVRQNLSIVAEAVVEVVAEDVSWQVQK